jgi:hypothetical protein
MGHAGRHVGIGGALTGEPVDILIIDDPFAGRADAESDTYRNRAWDWWENVGSTRLSARGRVLLMMTRWHEDDLAGRLLSREPGEWEVLAIPAICDDPAGDPLGRDAGVEMVSATHAPGHFVKTQELRSPYVWRSVYQQAPTAGEGNLFKRTDFRYWRPGPVSRSPSTGRRRTCGTAPGSRPSTSPRRPRPAPTGRSLRPGRSCRGVTWCSWTGSGSGSAKRATSTP